MLGYEESVTKAKNGVMVELTNIGEGIQGEYNENDPDDINLLRFYVYTNETHTSNPNDSDWTDIDSWCTMLPADMDNEKIAKALNMLFNEFYEALKNDHTVSIRRLGDTLSWTSEKDIDRIKNKTN